MKNYSSFLIFIWSILISSPTFSQEFIVSKCNDSKPVHTHPKSIALQQAMDKLTAVGIPGVVAAIYEEGNLWPLSSGLAKIEGQVPIQPCHLVYTQSIAKSYMAVVIMQLTEEGKIDLNGKISDYLPKEILAMLSHANGITIKMLLNHTSGLPEYNYDPTYVTRLLQNPKRIFQAEEYIQYITGKDLDFEPGSRYSYRNTNYVLLALIADGITGDHGKYMEEQIFEKLGLKKTYYRIQQGDSYGDRLVNGYWDRYSDGIVENASVLQNTNVASMVGDDGIITTAEEAILFLKGLMEGKLVSNESLNLMKEWVLDKKGDPQYGLGLDYTTFLREPAIGHSGGGLGSGSQLYYFPEKEIYMFFGINLGTVTDSPIHQDAEKILEEIYGVVLGK
jgi:D-alanyl-D-alanine carboxypeptidase